MLSPDFIDELRRHFRGDIRLDVSSRILYSTDASIYQIEPLGVVLPRTQEDLQSVVELAAKHRVPILARGSGSSLAGQAIGQALIVDCSRWLDSIIKIDPESRTAIVEPGVVLADLNLAASKYGLMFGPDPASAERATMGGVIGNNATGAHSILYGMTADHLVGADVILSDGSQAAFAESTPDAHIAAAGTRLMNIMAAALQIREKYPDAIRRNYPKSWRNSAGYRLNYLLPWAPAQPPQWKGGSYPADIQEGKINLAHLLAGSEGTLAVIRRATVKLVSRPPHTVLGILAYDSIAEACDAVPGLLERNPSAIELVPQLIIRLARSIAAYASQMGWVRGDPPALLVVEFSGEGPQALRQAARQLRADVVVAESAEDQARVWNVRKVGLGLLDSRPRSARPLAFIEDCAIPVGQLGGFVREVERIMAAHGTEGGIYAHASAGCLHIRPILDLKTGAGVRALRSIAEQTLALTLSLGGSMASEHGDGIARGEWLKRTYGAEITEAMRALKQAADPLGLLNPGKMFEAPPMDSNLRYGAGYRAQAWTPALDFKHNNGLSGAIEQCNGQGVCRKMTGVMCPSFQATREEQNSTRGRANLLRALIQTGLAQQEPGRRDLEASVYDALDLCLGCKGCRAECPSGVDMAKLKAEFQNHYYRSHRRPMRDYVFGYFHVAAKWFSALAPLANFATGNGLLRSSLARVLHIAPERPFPRFTRRRALPVRRGDRRKVLFLPDPYAHYVEPQVEQSAFDILDLLGFDVYVLPVVSAGAALVSKGFLEGARKHALTVLQALNEMDVDSALPIIGMEPPEIYSFKYDYPDLIPGRAEEIARRAEKAWLVEEFLVRSDTFRDYCARRELQIAETAHAPKVKFHPHCHQRAEGPAADGFPAGVEATLQVLRACGYQVELMEGGCCGMAGTFGYESEHFRLSMQVAELQLLPGLRALDSKSGEWVVASTGAACRMQIVQGTGWRAQHPLVLLRDRLAAMK
ncbi:MAG TPA: FAD-linked oxidase C-terminal domain-containing protein [Anaerolineales bacterium]|nr:FAD-linked oxidase C-terminal domain-containing protein [Anaerolineales bacterium]